MKRCTLLIVLWCVTLTGMAQLTTSDFPIVVIGASGTAISDTGKVQASMGVIYNGQGNVNALSDPFNNYDGIIGIKTRGNSTLSFDKKSYTVELWSSASTPIDSSLAGLPAESEWVLHAMYIDKSLLRIPMSFYLAQQMGQYASRWRYVELVLNGDYKGVYALVEKIKQGPNRVSIDADEGHILRIDWLDGGKGFESLYPSLGGQNMFFQYHYPKNSAMNDVRKDQIRDEMDRFEEAVFDEQFTNLNGEHYRDLCGLESFVDFFLINELSKNSDGYKLSSYVHRDGASIDARLKAGPIWDFDQTYGLSTVCSGHIHCGWTYLENMEGCEDLQSMPRWWERMTADSVFCKMALERWAEYRRTFLHTDSINQWIDACATTLAEPQSRNFTRWPVLGEEIWAEPYPVPTDYQGEIDILKSWITRRSEWMDRNLLALYDMSSSPGKVKLYPNPTTTQVNVTIVPGAQIWACDITGRQVWHGGTCSESSYLLNVADWQSGTYIIYTKTDRGVFSGKLVVR